MDSWNDSYPTPYVNDVHRCLPKSSRFDENCLTDSGETIRIPMERPEDMFDPSKINPAFLPIIITHAITFIIGIAGNIIVILTWAGRGKLRSPTTAFLVSLAIADLLLLIVYVPLETLEYFAITWDVGGSVCKLSSYVEMLCGISSVLNLVAVSIERFLVIVYPIKARRLCTLSTSRRGLLLVWSLAVILALPVVFTKRIYPITYYNSSTSATAYYCWDADDDWAAFIAIYQLLAMFAIPGVLMVICYFCVIQELWVSTRKMASMTKNSGTPTPITVTATGLTVDSATTASTVTTTTATTTANSSSVRHDYQLKWPSNKHEKIVYPKSHSHGFQIRQARKQVIKMLIFVVLIFLFCWGPRLIINVIIKFGLQDYNQTIYSARVTCYLLSFIHSALNPFIYGFMSTNFRKMMCSSCSHHGQASQSVNYINNNTGSCSLASGIGPGLASPNHGPLGLSTVTTDHLSPHHHNHNHNHHHHHHHHHIIGCVRNSVKEKKVDHQADHHLLAHNNTSDTGFNSTSCTGPQIEYDLSSYTSITSKTGNIQSMETETV